MPAVSYQPQSITLAHSTSYQDHKLLASLREKGWLCLGIENPSELEQLDAAVLLLDQTLLEDANINAWRLHAQDCLLVCEESICEDADLVLPQQLPMSMTIQSLELASRQWWYKRRVKELDIELKGKVHDLENMASIGISLSAERDLTQLLRNILSQAQLLACCDASSLFLVDRSAPNNPQLVFKLTQNDSMDFPFEEISFPLDDTSLAGYVASHNHELNIDDVYNIPNDAPYTFNYDTNLKTGYRTVSQLTIPIRNYRDEVIGVLQFINRKRNRSTKLTTAEIALQETLPFDDDITLLLHALASQSAIALENNILLDSINHLFEGFVNASVVAIEQRDPCTSGHSFRVADLSITLAQALPRSQFRQFKDVCFSENAIRELRYAALLHDFGKVGVREQILTKPKKLHTSDLHLIVQRIRLAQERLKRETLERILKLKGGPLTERQFVEQKLEEEVQRLETYLKAILQANEPTILAEGSDSLLREIKQYPYLDIDRDDLTGLLNDEEFHALSVEKGSLTYKERLEIQSHVNHTERFLRMIPWTPELCSRKGARRSSLSCNLTASATKGSGVAMKKA